MKQVLPHDRKEHKMKLCTCKECRYIFPAQFLPVACPDCGKQAVRDADEQESRDYRRFQEIIREEIRLGVITG